ELFFDYRSLLRTQMRIVECDAALENFAQFRGRLRHIAGRQLRQNSISRFEIQSRSQIACAVTRLRGSFAKYDDLLVFCNESPQQRNDPIPVFPFLIFRSDESL